MKILNALNTVKINTYDFIYRCKYKFKLESVGEHTKFGGCHITIVGGRKHNGKGISVGRNCTIYDYCLLVTEDFEDSGITIGNNCHFNYGCYLAGIGGLSIGDNCLFGPGVKILTGGHKFDDINTSIIKQGPTRGPVNIENNIWIGAGAIIMPNVTIKSGAVIAAGAVVTKVVAENTIVAGVPAVPIDRRGT